MTAVLDTDEAKVLLDALIAGELPDERGRFGPFGGRYVPETLVPAFERLEQAPIDEVVVTNTIPLNERAQEVESIKVLSVASMLGEAIKRIHRNESISNLFNNI